MRTGKYHEYNSDKNRYTSDEAPFGSSMCDDECVHKAEAYASIGFTEAQAAEAIGAHPTTFRTWIDKYPRMRDAWNRGVTKLRLRAHQCLMEQAFPMEKDARSGKHTPTGKGNPQLMLAYFKSMEGWTETSKQIIEDDRKTFDDMDKHEKIKRLEELEEKTRQKIDKVLEEFTI